MMFTAPVTLRGEHVLLSPLTPDDAAGLAAASADGDLSSLWVTPVPAPSEMDEFVAGRLAEVAAGSWVAFVVRTRPEGRIVGLTNYLNLDPVHPRVEIGGTWYAASAQRTAVNTETKLLLLGHAFENLGCLAVELRTHVRNLRSRAAIERLGAHQDGILRKHRILPDGSFRDTVVYSILDDEWPAVRDRLRARLSR
ncbi:MAG: GNAT family protein [Micropruina sp.]